MYLIVKEVCNYGVFNTQQLKAMGQRGQRGPWRIEKQIPIKSNVCFKG